MLLIAQTVSWQDIIPFLCGIIALTISIIGVLVMLWIKQVNSINKEQWEILNVHSVRIAEISTTQELQAESLKNTHTCVQQRLGKMDSDAGN